MIVAGDKVKFNNKYSDTEKYQGNEYKVRCVGKVCGSSCVWLEGISGCFALDAVELIKGRCYD